MGRFGFGFGGHRILARAALGVVVAAGLAACGDGADDDAVAASAETAELASSATEAPTTPIDLAARAPQGILPDDADLIAVDLNLTIDPREERFSGEATLTLDFTRALDGLWLHGQNLNVTDAELTLADGAVLAVSYAEITEPGVAHVTFPRDVAAGRVYLRLAYDAAFDPNLSGMFRVEENGDFYALAKSESIQARKYLPGFDEPRFKAVYTTTITAPAGYAVIANTPEVARESVGGGMERVSFAPTRPLPTYLLSLAVGPFDVVERPDIPANVWRDEPLPLRGYARRGKGAELDFILDLTPHFITAYEEAFASPYPFATLAVVAAPDWPSGATELAGAPTYREDIILAAGAPDPGQERRIVGIHAHELAHMWFGDLVTPAWWDELWLKEAYAVWATPIAAAAWDPDGGYEFDRPSRLVTGLRADSLAASRAVREPILLNRNIRNAYDGITYSKGGAVITMMEAYLGADRFRDGVQQIMDTYVDGSVVSEDYYAAFDTAAAGADAAAIFTAFVDRPGAPYVQASLSCPADGAPEVTLTQSRYRPLGSAIDPDQTWPLPVCLAFQAPGGPGRTCTLARTRETTVTLDTDTCPAWVMPNAGAVGYYRFDLDADGWTALAAAFEDVSAVEAMIAVDSAVAGFEAGATDAASFITIIEAAARHPHHRVAAAPLAILRRLSHRVLAQDSERDVLAAWVRDLYGPRLDALSGASTSGERLLKAELRSLLANVGADAAVRGELAANAAAFVGFERPRDPAALSPDLYAMSLGVAVEDLGRPFAEHLLAARQEIDDSRFRRAVIGALARTRDVGFAEEVRALALSAGTEPSEAEGLAFGLLANTQLRAANWSWFTANLPELAAKAPSQRRRFLPRVAGGFCDAGRVDELEALFAEHGDLMPGHEHALAQTAEAIALCAALRDAVAGELTTALAARAPG